MRGRCRCGFWFLIIDKHWLGESWPCYDDITTNNHPVDVVVFVVLVHKCVGDGDIDGVWQTLIMTIALGFVMALVVKLFAARVEKRQQRTTDFTTGWRCPCKRFHKLIIFWGVINDSVRSIVINYLQFTLNTWRFTIKYVGLLLRI